VLASAAEPRHHAARPPPCRALGARRIGPRRGDVCPPDRCSAIERYSKSRNRKSIELQPLMEYLPPAPDTVTAGYPDGALMGVARGAGGAVRTAAHHARMPACGGRNCVIHALPGGYGSAFHAVPGGSRWPFATRMARRCPVRGSPRGCSRSVCRWPVQRAESAYGRGPRGRRLMSALVYESGLEVRSRCTSGHL